MITHGDKEMIEVPEEWENVDDAEPILDFDKIKYQQFLLDNLDLEEEQPEEENAEPSEQPECSMNV
jgi:hypothetical protein